MKKYEKPYRLFYDERIEDIVIAKDLLYKSLETLNEKHSKVYISDKIHGESRDKIANKYGYAPKSVPVIISNTGADVKSNLKYLSDIEE
jgi:hypothetical protein